ncbi:MAG: Hsp70 family protein [Blastochloris sp.]|nr:Hsp70 family protein [Blastochloris sp.]
MNKDTSTAVIGIDLGTTNSLVGVMDAGFTVLIPDGEGRRLLPSVVSWSGGEGETVLTGYAAKRRRLLAPKQTVYSAKRLMGRRWSELSEEEKALDYEVVADGEGRAMIDLGGERVSPGAVATELLRELKRRAEHYLEGPVWRAVITVPAYFHDAQRQATKEAGEAAGLEVLRIVSEPTAAALAYGMDRAHRQARLAVFDLGGGTFDCSILELNDGVFQVLSTSGDTLLGGDDIDRAVVGCLRQRIPEQVVARLDAVAEARLREEAEQLKIRLSSEESVRVELPFFCGDYHFETSLSRQELEGLARPIVERTRRHVQRALQDAGLKAEELQEILLVGGQTRMPLVRELVEQWFGRKPQTELDPDEAVARGAVIQAGILSGAVRDMVLLDVTPLSLGIETFGGLMNVIIPRNTTIPTKAGELFTNAVDGQREMRVRILQGERELAKDNWILGELNVPFHPGLRGTARVGVQFELDQDGILHVLTRDTKTGEEVKMQIRSVINVADEKVEEMVAASVEHALEDMQERRWVEAEQKAKRLLGVTEKALVQAEGRAEPEMLEPVRKALARLKGALESRDLGALKTAMKDLDQQSQPLAQWLMDWAMEQALARKMESS